MKEGICFGCKHFDAKAWIENEGRLEAIRGAAACKSNGIASRGMIACSSFEPLL